MRRGGALPKGASPAGFRVRGLAFADPLGQRVLERGTVPHWWEADRFWVYVAEGVPDWLVAATGFSEADTGAPAVLGLISGSWTRAIARRIPDGSQVTVATHSDATGCKYAERVRETVGTGRCSFLRVGGAA